MLMGSEGLDLEPASRMLRAMGDETRLRIVALLSHGELCVCHVETALRLSQPNASRQLAILRAAGIVEFRRDKNWVYYGLRPQTHTLCKRLLSTLAKSFRAEERLARDVERLVASKGPAACR